VENELTLTKLVSGLARLKGEARSIDLIGLTFKISSLWDILLDLKQMTSVIQKDQNAFMDRQHLIPCCWTASDTLVEV